LDYVRFGLGLVSDFKGDAYFNLIGTYTKTWLNSYGGEWRNDVQVGRTNSFLTEFYQPLNPEGHYFIAPHFGIERRTTDLYQGENRVATYDIGTGLIGVDIGSRFGRYGELRVGVVRGRMEPKLDTGPQSLSPGPTRVDQGAGVVRLLLDRLDSLTFPREGWRTGLRVYDSNERFGADQDYTKWDVDGSAVHSFGNHTVNLSWKLGGKVGGNPLPPTDQFQWGGFLQQSGYATGQLIGEKMSFGRLMYYQRILRGTLLEGAYGGISLEAGKYGDPLVPGNPSGTLYSGSLFVAADTPIGPVYVGYGRGQNSNSSWYFFVGRPY